MAEDNLELRCKNAIIRIADDVRDINHKLSHFIENYRDDYYSLRNEKKYGDLY